VTDWNRAEVAEQKAEVYRLTLKGWTRRKIAEELGISLGTVQNRLDEAIKETVLPLAEDVRKQQLDRLDTYLVSLDAKIEKGDDKAINTALRIEERRARLLGLDAPQQLSQTITAAPEVLTLIEAARARQEAEEAVLRNEL